jgi:hypothetical protein
MGIWSGWLKEGRRFGCYSRDFTWILERGGVAILFRVEAIIFIDRGEARILKASYRLTMQTGLFP